MLALASRVHHLPLWPPETNRMRRYTLFVLCVLAGVPAGLRAQGFGIYELGSCGMARAGTGVATPCPDGSAIFFNPAGLAGLTGWHMSAGGTLIKAVGTYRSESTLGKSDLHNPWIQVPHLYVAYGATPKLGIGSACSRRTAWKPAGP